jgi:hypothetical protein
VAAEALHDLGGPLLVATHDLAPVLGVESRGEARGVDEIAEEHRELAALDVRGGRLCTELLGPGFARSAARPGQDVSLRHRDLLNGHQLLGERRELVVVESEFAPEGAKRDATVLPKVRLGSRDRLEEAHASGSSSRASRSFGSCGVKTSSPNASTNATRTEVGWSPSCLCAVPPSQPDPASSMLRLCG